MTVKDKKAEDVKIAYIGGGSRGWAWGLMSDLASEPNMSGTVTLYDIDHQAAKDNQEIGNRIAQNLDAKSVWKYEYKPTLQDALTGADFVVISILPGTFEEMLSDVNTPKEYGIYQPVGDTVGPGGLVRALRTVPMYVEIANAIKAFCPNAWVINYTNPMTVCTQTLFTVFPQIKAIGCCHEVFGSQRLLATAANQVLGLDIKRQDIKVDVVGINHFTFVTKATYDNIDLFPVMEKFVDLHYETGFNKDAHTRDYEFFDNYHRVQFDLFRRYGVVGTADRHSSEFCPKGWYLNDPQTIAHWKVGLTPVEYRRDIDLKDRMEKSAKLLSGEDKFEIDQTGEEGVPIMKAVLGLGDFVTNCNYINKGQMPQFPLGSVVETNVLLSCDNISPIISGDMPGELAGLNLTHVYNQKMIIQAAMNGDYNLAFNTFINDPLVDLKLCDSRKLFDKMIANTIEYLPYWN